MSVLAPRLLSISWQILFALWRWVAQYKNIRCIMALPKREYQLDPDGFMRPEMSEDVNLPQIELLESAPHFSYLSFDDKARLVRYMKVEDFMPGDCLIHEGEDLTRLFFIIEGAVEIIKASASGEKVALATLGRGEIVGETALQPAASQSTVVVRAREKTRALVLPGKSFRNLIIDSPGTAFKVMFDVLKLLRRRLNQVSNRLADSLTGGKG